MPGLFKERPDELAKRMIETVYGPDVKLPNFGLGMDAPGMAVGGRVSYDFDADKVVLPITNPFTGNELAPQYGFLGHDQSPAERRHAEELIGSIFHIPPEQVTEQHSTVYTVAHELGHWRADRDAPGSLQASLLARDDFYLTVIPDPSAPEIAYRESLDERLAADNAAFVIQTMIQVHGDDAFPGLANGWKSPEHIAAEGVPSLKYIEMDDNYLWHAYAPNLVLPEIQALSVVVPEQGEEVPGSRVGRSGTEMSDWARTMLQFSLGVDGVQPEWFLGRVHEPLVEIMERLPEADRQILTIVALAEGKMPTLDIDLNQARPTVGFMNDLVERLVVTSSLDLEGILDAQSEERHPLTRADHEVVEFVQSHSELYRVQEPLTTLAHARLSDEDEALASGQKLPQSDADERRRTMLEAYLNDVALTVSAEPDVSLAELHLRQTDAALSKVDAGLPLDLLDEWAFERGISGEPVIDEAWNGLSRSDRRLAVDAETPALRYVHDVAALSRADPTRMLDDIAHELEANVPAMAPDTPYANWLVDRSFERLVDEDVTYPPLRMTTANRDAGDDVRSGTEMSDWARTMLQFSLGVDGVQPERFLDRVHESLAEIMERLPEADRQILTTVALAENKMPTLDIDLNQGRQTVGFMNDFIERLVVNPTLDLEGILDAQSEERHPLTRADHEVVEFVQSHSELYRVQEPLTALAHARLSDEDEVLASGQKLPQSDADERRRTMLEAYLNDVALTASAEPDVSLAELHLRQTDAALLKADAGLPLDPLDEWAFERGISGGPVIDGAWNGLRRSDRRLAVDAETPAIRYVHDVAALSRADPTRTLDDIAHELEANVPATAPDTPYANWLVDRSLDRLLDEDVTYPPSRTTTANRDAGDDVHWSDLHVEIVLDRSGQQQVWPGQLTELWQTQHMAESVELGARSSGALDVVGLSPVVHRDVAMPDMSFVVMTVAVENGVMPMLWGVPDVVGQPCKTLPLSAEPLEQNVGLGVAALADRMLMAKTGGLAGVAELTHAVHGLSAENLVDVVMIYPMTTKMPVLGGPFGPELESEDAMAVVAGAAGVDLRPRTPNVAEIKLEAEPLASHDHEMGMGW